MTHRRGCGTHMGLLLHLELDEALCPTCLHGERMRTLELERRQPLPIAPWTVNEGPTAGYEALQRHRLLWDVAADSQTAVAPASVDAVLRSFPAKALMTPPIPVDRETCAGGATATTTDQQRTA